MSDSPHAHYGVVDPEWAALSASVPKMVDIDSVTFRHTIQKQLVEACIQQVKEKFDATKFKSRDHSVPVANGTTSINIRLITPTAPDDATFPVVYWLHGGGFTAGHIDFTAPHLIPLVLDFQVAVALVDYRLAPEDPHPAQINDTFDGVKWLLNNAASLQVDISKGFIIGGESAGASLVASVTHLIRDDPFFEGKQPTGQILQIPVTIDPRAYPEKYKPELRSMYMTENADITGLTRPIMEKVYVQYLQNDPSDYTCSPLLWPSHANLPPALFQIAGLDLLRDEGLLYEKLIREAGNKTRLIVYPGVPHGHHMLYENLSASKKFNADFNAGFQWLLSGAND